MYCNKTIKFTVYPEQMHDLECERGFDLECCWVTYNGYVFGIGQSFFPLNHYYQNGHEYLVLSKTIWLNTKWMGHVCKKTKKWWARLLGKHLVNQSFKKWSTLEWFINTIGTQVILFNFTKFFSNTHRTMLAMFNSKIDWFQE